MVNDISGNADTALTVGDRLSDFKPIEMHSIVHVETLKNNEVEFFKPSENSLEIATYKGMAVIVDDELSSAAGVYTTVLMGYLAIGFGAGEPNTGFGTEILRVPAAGNGGGQTVLHSRMNVGLHPLGYSKNTEQRQRRIRSAFVISFAMCLRPNRVSTRSRQFRSFKQADLPSLALA